MKQFRCIIIEDEPLAQERVSGYLTHFSDFNCVGCFENAIQALLYLKSNPVDVIFLDINIGEFNGIQFAETLTFPADIIFTTAYSEHALKGFELNATDYLLKPFTLERFSQAIEKVRNKNVSVVATPIQKDFIFIKTEYRLEKIAFDSILYIEGMRDYRRIVTKNKRIMTLQTFKELEEEIPSDIICRVHKSYMINIQHIQAIERDRILIQEQLIPISETYRSRFFELIGR